MSLKIHHKIVFIIAAVTFLFGIIYHFSFFYSFPYAFGLAWGISILSGYFLAYYFSGRIRQVLHMAKRMALGDFSGRIFFKGQDEIAQLAQALNEVSGKVNSRVDKADVEKSHLEVVLLSLSEGVLVIDQEERIILINDSLCKILEVHGEFVGKKSIEIIRHRDIQDLIAQVRNHPQKVQSREIALAVGQERIFNIHATSILREGSFEGVVLIFHDITDLRRLEKIRQEFVANVSHELRTPIASIKGYAETLLDGALDNKKDAREFVDIIHTDSERLARLINDLLDLSRVEFSRFQMERKPCLLKPIIEKVLVGLQPQITAKFIKVEDQMGSPHL
ncbi:MAG: HAMP domain-containing protein, partial [Candidatus Omnitrophica bacterium]|nr:HAMP domain-containing protein [Candidatus Omnitrophota bacterium]